MADCIDWFTLTDEEMLDAAEKLIIEEPGRAEVSALVRAVVEADGSGAADGGDETDSGDDGPGH